jgi:peptide/nickel transport system ATP-binding protein
MRQLRGNRLSMIFQEPMTSLNPAFTVGEQIVDVLRQHRAVGAREARERALHLFERVGISAAAARLRQYPHELSGGLRQRALIAMALICGPSLLLADEPTTALDATVQVQVLILLRKLQKEFGMALMFVTHDLGVAAQIADRVAVMYAGRIVEEGSAREVLLNPRHPYTIGMLASTLHGRVRGHDIEAIPGSPPDMRVLSGGCSFAPRCRFANASCQDAVPSPIMLESGHRVSCHRVGELSPCNTVAVS